MDFMGKEETIGGNRNLIDIAAVSKHVARAKSKVVPPD